MIRADFRCCDLHSSGARTIGRWGSSRGIFKTEPSKYVVVGNEMRCEICDHDLFFQRTGQISTAGLSFFELDWLNASANCVVCARCGYVPLVPADELILP